MEKRFKLQNRLLSPYTTKRGDITLYLLKNKPASGKPFKLLATIQNFGTDTETTQFRSRPFFEIAKSEKSFGDLIGTATHVAVVPNGEVFSIREGDEIQVQQTDFTYRLYAELTSQRFSLARDTYE